MSIFRKFFKKEEELHYDPSDIKLTDMQKGFVFEYDLQNWVVKSVYNYDWGNNNFTKEYQVDNGKEVRYLSVEEDDELFLTFTQKIKIRTIDAELPEYILSKEKPPQHLIYETINFYLDSENPGYYNDPTKGKNVWEELIEWSYYDQEEKFALILEQWGEQDFEAAYGKIIKEFEISNILPG